MSFQITESFVQQYRNNVIHLSQQKGSRLRDTVRMEGDINGKTYYFERIGATAAVVRQSRHQDTPLVSTPHSRRRVALVSYEWADLVDSSDKIRTLINPESEYAQAGSNAMGRAIDDAIIAAARGTAYAGEDGSTTVALGSDQQIVHGSAGLTLAKLTAAKRILDSADVDPDEPRVIVVSPKMLEYLLTNVAEIKSIDYNTVKALVQGEINTFMGFRWIMSNRLPSSGTGYRYAIAYAKNGIGLAVGQDIQTSIDKRPDKSNSVQVFLSMDIGATRIEEAKVVEIDTTE